MHYVYVLSATGLTTCYRCWCVCWLPLNVLSAALCGRRWMFHPFALTIFRRWRARCEILTDKGCYRRAACQLILHSTRFRRFDARKTETASLLLRAFMVSRLDRVTVCVCARICAAFYYIDAAREGAVSCELSTLPSPLVFILFFFFSVGKTL